MDVQLNWEKIKDNPVLYNCNGMNSTNPYCTKPFDPNNIEDNGINYKIDYIKEYNLFIESFEDYNNNYSKQKIIFLIIIFIFILVFSTYFL